MKSTNLLIKGVCAAALCASLSQPVAHAFTDPPSIGEVIGNQVGDVINSMQAHAASKQQFNALLYRKRADYFGKYPNKTGFKEAEVAFANILFEKDVYFLSQYLAEGTSADAMKRMKGMERLTGGELDGGIHRSAWAAFSRWVDAVRRPLGGKRRGQLIFVMDSNKLMRAIESANQEYAAYKQQRDAAEFRAQGIQWQGGGQGNQIQPAQSNSPANSYEARWEKQCMAEKPSHESETSHRAWCNCVVDGISEIQSSLSKATKEALAAGFVSGISKVGKENSRGAEQAMGACFI